MTKWCCFRPENTSPPSPRPVNRPTPPPAVSAVPSPAPNPTEEYLKVVRKNQQDRGDKPPAPVQGLGEMLVNGVNRGAALVQGQGERLVNMGVGLVHGLVQGQGGGGGGGNKNKNKKNGGVGLIGQGLGAVMAGGAMMVGGAKNGVGLVQGLMGYEDQAAKDLKAAQLHCHRNDHPAWGEKRHRPGNPKNYS